MIDLNEWSKKIHNHNVKVGWWDNNPCIYEKLQLVSTEIAEATEAERKDSMDDKLPHRKGGEVELADALIRVLDIGAHLDLGYYAFLKPRNLSRIESIAGEHLVINKRLIDFAFCFYGGCTKTVAIKMYSRLINQILRTSEKFGYDLESSMIEKFEYNKTRADHKRENRAKEGGKKF